MRSVARSLLAGAASCALALPATALPVLISESPWGTAAQGDWDKGNFDRVFGSNAFTFYGSYAGAPAAASLLTAGTSLLMLEGGNFTTQHLNSYLAANAADILSWVSKGGVLVLQAAAVLYPVTFNGVTLSNLSLSASATLTAAGEEALPGIDTRWEGKVETAGASRQLGLSVIKDSIVSQYGLTSLMEADTALGPGTGNSLVAGGALGCGYVLYSGLTVSRWQKAYSTPGEVADYRLSDALLGYAASNPNTACDTVPQAQTSTPVPEPASLPLLALAMGMLAALRPEARRAGPLQRRA